MRSEGRQSSDVVHLLDYESQKSGSLRTGRKVGEPLELKLEELREFEPLVSHTGMLRK